MSPIPMSWYPINMLTKMIAKGRQAVISPQLKATYHMLGLFLKYCYIFNFYVFIFKRN